MAQKLPDLSGNFFCKHNIFFIKKQANVRRMRRPELPKAMSVSEARAAGF